MWNKFDEFLWHVKTVWYRIRTGQVQVWWTKPETRIFGPYYDWYDGPHYSLGFWFFGIGFEDLKDHEEGMMKYRFKLVMNKLLRLK